ncbi:MAG: hypothetical protein ABIQ16_22090 [Polyangiaceae bacterium]
MPKPRRAWEVPIESGIVDSATPVDFEGAGSVPVANAEELLAMKVLSMTDTRLQDRIDAQRLLQFTPKLDLARAPTPRSNHGPRQRPRTGP